MRTAVIFDLDGCLSDDAHRKELNVNRDWAEYNARLYLDKPNRGVLAILKAMAVQGHKVILCTGRDSIFKAATLSWLEKYEITEWDDLMMRDQGDTITRDFLVKQRMYDQLKVNHDVLFVIEDKQSVVDMWRSNGLTVLQCTGEVL